jgi:hypothetical protein
MNKENTAENIVNSSTTAVILGNGTSRFKMHNQVYKQLGTVYGCNAIYREYTPDYLIAVDPIIIKEISESDFPQDKVLIPEGDERFEPKEMYVALGRPEVVNTPKIGAGQYAIIKAIQAGFKTIKIFGFDFLFEDADECVSNIYAGTDAYTPETASTVDQSRYRMVYFQWLFQKYPDIQFEFYFPENSRVFFFDYKNVMYSTFRIN